MAARLHYIREKIFPKTCIYCKQTGTYLCSDCKKKIQPHPEICPYCHKFSENYQTCLDCKINHYNVLEGIIIPFSYSNVIKKLILDLKYYHHKDIADFLGDKLILALQSNPKITHNIKNSPVIITDIPSHRYRKHFIKGYNQSEVLANNMSSKLQIPYIPLLQKPHSTKSQTKLKRNERLINLQWKFINNSLYQLEGNGTIIIIDDITTTGSSLNEAAATIKQRYPHTKIRWLVVARHC